MATLPCRVILGKTTKIFDGALSGSGEQCIDFVLDGSDSLLASLYVRSVTSGTVSAVVYTKSIDGEEVPVVTFPDITAPSTELLLKKAAVGLSNMKLCITHTGDAEVSVYGKGLNAGETSVRVLGASNGKVSQQDILAGTAQVLVPSALTDRAGMVIKNNEPAGGTILYIGYTIAETTVANGYPMSAGEAMGIDMAAGVEIYALAASGTIDVRIMEADS